MEKILAALFLALMAHLEPIMGSSESRPMSPNLQQNPVTKAIKMRMKEAFSKGQLIWTIETSENSLEYIAQIKGVDTEGSFSLSYSLDHEFNFSVSQFLPGSDTVPNLSIESSGTVKLQFPTQLGIIFVQFTNLSLFQSFLNGDLVVDSKTEGETQIRYRRGGSPQANQFQSLTLGFRPNDLSHERPKSNQVDCPFQLDVAF